jgi:hypothetical protein
MAAFNKEEALFASSVDFNLRQKPVKYRIWSTALNSAENLTLRKADLQYLGSLKNLVLEWTEKTGWNNCVRNEIIHGLKKFYKI